MKEREHNTDHSIPPSLPFDAAVSARSSLQSDILRVLCYFDIFQHPLTPEEIYSYLPSNSTSPEQVRDACCSPPLDQLVVREGEFFSIAFDVVTHRRNKERRARRYWKIARLMGRILRIAPFVRAIFVSGELSKGVVSHNGDIDYVIIVAPGRLWVCRTLLVLFKRAVLFNSRRFLCFNHLQTEDCLAVEEHNIYTAVELATLRPVFNEPLLRQYLKSNEWITAFLPNVNLSASTPDELRPRASTLQRLLELPLRGALGDRLDDYLLMFWRAAWEKRYRHLPEEKRRRLFRTEKSISTAYAGDFLPSILSEYRSRLRRFNLEEKREAAA